MKLTYLYNVTTIPDNQSKTKPTNTLYLYIPHIAHFIKHPHTTQFSYR